MSDRRFEVLLVKERSAGASSLVERLQNRGCECQFATSYGEAVAVLGKHRFDLVLSELGLLDGRASRLIPWLIGSDTTLFFCLAVEDDCWWLPAIVYGHDCWGAPALRRSEFLHLLDDLLQEMRSAGPASSVDHSAILAKLCVSGCAVGHADVEVPAGEPATAAPPRARAAKSAA